MKIVKASDHAADDANLYFRDCIGVYTKEGVSNYVRYGIFDDEKLKVFGITNEMLDLPMRLPKKDLKLLTFPVVPSGFVNITDEKTSFTRSVYINRRPIRQFAWGFNLRSYQLHHIDSVVASKLNKSTLSIKSLDTVKGIFEPTYYTVDQALDLMLNAKATSVALDKDVALTFKVGSGNIMVYHHTSLVGEIVDKKLEIYKEATFCKEVLFEHFNQEEVQLDEAI